MSDFCIICECEPIEPTGWIQMDDGEWVCPWCVKDALIGVSSAW